jgi:type I restriction enzyme, S subunit
VISKDMVENVYIPIPPLSDQQRIVAILDEAFAGIAIAKANAEKNLQNARGIFESHLKGVFERAAIERGTRLLIELCDLFVDSAHRTPKYQPEGIPALRPRDVVKGNLDIAGSMRVSKTEYLIQTKRYQPKPGDIVFSRELSCGWAAVLPKAPIVCLSQGMCLFRPSRDVDAKFLLFFLNSPVGREQSMRAAVGTAHPHINLGDIKGFRVPCPPLDIQTRNAEEFGMLEVQAGQLWGIYERKLAALDALKRSLLHRAFAGELTANRATKLVEAVA